MCIACRECVLERGNEGRKEEGKAREEGDIGGGGGGVKEEERYTMMFLKFVVEVEFIDVHLSV